MPWTFSRPRLQWKPPVNDPGMHHGTCETHLPWFMSGSLTCGGGETFPAFLAHAQPVILRIWQEAHCTQHSNYTVLPRSSFKLTKTPLPRPFPRSGEIGLCFNETELCRLRSGEYFFLQHSRCQCLMLWDVWWGPLNFKPGACGRSRCISVSRRSCVMFAGGSPIQFHLVAGPSVFWWSRSAQYHCLQTESRQANWRPRPRACIFRRVWVYAHGLVTWQNH